MASNIDIDQKLLEEVVALGKYKSKKTAVNCALKELRDSLQQAGIVKLFGKISFDASYNYKKQRRVK